MNEKVDQPGKIKQITTNYKKENKKTDIMTSSPFPFYLKKYFKSNKKINR